MGKSRIDKEKVVDKQKALLEKNTTRRERNQYVATDLSKLDNKIDIVSNSQSISKRKIDDFVDALSNKRVSVREKALIAVMDLLESNGFGEVLESRYITLLYEYLKFIEKGTIKEASIACRSIGLLAICVGCTSKVEEIIEQSTPIFSKVLESRLNPQVRSSLFQCIAIVTFVGNNPCETQMYMKTIWEAIEENSNSNHGQNNKIKSSVLVTDLTAWSFLLTKLDHWRIDSNKWKGSISLFTTLLEDADSSTRIAAGEAIALIFETGRAYNFCRAEDDCELVKDTVKTLASRYSIEAKQNEEKRVFGGIFVFLNDGTFQDKSIKFANKCGELKVSTWARAIQLNFIKCCLGAGFRNQMQSNEFLQDLFGLSEEDDHQTWDEKMANYTSHKERMQLRNKQRKLVEEQHFGFDSEEGFT
ncbi:Interferon-related protein PC4 like protein [Dioscorea alata]|uniref:Interferon-related protein PC4 like protein n=1 Tax=Dioscorea alata TaxID=55571 RepID=A0ACB7UJZ3_DIOAL|nr:Interferon-related protein PC4 like protein [Dioscorea alata]